MYLAFPLHDFWFINVHLITEMVPCNVFHTSKKALV